MKSTHRDYCKPQHWHQHSNGDVHDLTVIFHTTVIDGALHRVVLLICHRVAASSLQLNVQLKCFDTKTIQMKEAKSDISM